MTGPTFRVESAAQKVLLFAHDETLFRSSDREH